jgi:hypothetical protein
MYSVAIQPFTNQATSTSNAWINPFLSIETPLIERFRKESVHDKTGYCAARLAP